MKPQTIKINFISTAKKRVVACCFIFLFSVSFLFANPPEKCCNQADSLKTEVKKMEPLEEPMKCNKEEDKKDKNFTMMSLNLMYYLISKFISSSSFDQD